MDLNLTELTSFWERFKIRTMSDQQLVFGLIIVVSLLTASMTVIIYRILFHPLSRFPGPFWAKVTGGWRNKRYLKGQWHQEILDIHKKYGRVVRIAPNELAIVDEQAMKLLLSHSHNAEKTSWYTHAWDPPYATSLFSTTDKKIHAILRKRIAQAYSMTSILKYEEYIQKCLDLLMYKIQKHAATEDIIDISTWTDALAFDVVGELAYGEQLGHLRTETDVGGLRKDLLGGFALLANIGHHPVIAFLLKNKVTQALVPPPFAEFSQWSTEKIKYRMENLDKTNREDMLSHFCRMKTNSGDPVSLQDILTEAMVLVGAGADTTSGGMKACLYYLSQNPKYYELLQAEVDGFYKNNNLTEPITYQQTLQLPMLQAVVKESMRLFPSIPFQLLRHAPDGFTIRDYYIPAGTPVGISPIAQNRDQEIWGDDADEFRPDRWIEDETKAKYFDTSTLTFGGNGPRMCIGRNIALVEIQKFVAQFVRNFDFELANPLRPWQVKTAWFAHQYDFKLEIISRANRNLRTPEGVDLHEKQ